MGIGTVVLAISVSKVKHAGSGAEAVLDHVAATLRRGDGACREQNKAPNPLYILLFCLDAVMLHSDAITHRVEQFGAC